jgi:hypothetical protein
MTIFHRLANVFRMSDETWRRHANPWSVYTRFAAIPAMILAIWSRTWIGGWAWLPVAFVLGWLWWNPRAFPAVTTTRSWAARGIYGEKLWLQRRHDVPASFRSVFHGLIALGAAGLALLAWGLVHLRVWPTVFGATLIVLGQLWRIDRMGLLYEESQGQSPLPAND